MLFSDKTVFRWLWFPLSVPATRQNSLSRNADLLKSFIIKDKTYNYELSKSLGGTDTKLSSPGGIYLVSDRNYNIAIIKLNFTGYISASFILKYPEFQKSWISIKLPGTENILSMFVNCSDKENKQFLHFFWVSQTISSLETTSIFAGFRSGIE